MAEASANDDSRFGKTTRLWDATPTVSRSGTTRFEFLIDCGQMSTEGGVVRLTRRVATNPRSAKELCRTLQHSLSEYERPFGETPGERED